MITNKSCKWYISETLCGQGKYVFHPSGGVSFDHNNGAKVTCEGCIDYYNKGKYLHEISTEPQKYIDALSKLK